MFVVFNLLYVDFDVVFALDRTLWLPYCGERVDIQTCQSLASEVTGRRGKKYFRQSLVGSVESLTRNGGHWLLVRTYDPGRWFMYREIIS